MERTRIFRRIKDDVPGPRAEIAPVAVSSRLLRRVFGGVDDGPLSWAQVRTTVYKDEFAIIEVHGAGSAILDLQSRPLVCAVFELTSEQALAKLAAPGGVEEVRAFIAEHPRLLPMEHAGWGG